MEQKKRLRPWSVRNSKYVFVDRWIKVRADDCMTADGTTVSPYYVLEYPHWVHMVVMDQKHRILVTRQYRHAARRITMELPCGTMEPHDKSPLVAAKRELLEETGYTGTFVLAGITSPNPATHTNSIYTYLVTHPLRKKTLRRNPFEIMSYGFIPLNKVLASIEKKDFAQAMHIGSFFLGLIKGHIKLPA